MIVLKFDYDVQNGFAYILVDGKNVGDEMIVQCCLKHDDKNNDSSEPIFLPVIDRADCGHNWGMCFDANKKAFEYWGENRCMTALFHHAKKNGITLN